MYSYYNCHKMHLVSTSVWTLITPTSPSLSEYALVYTMLSFYSVLQTYVRSNQENHMDGSVSKNPKYYL